MCEPTPGLPSKQALLGGYVSGVALKVGGGQVLQFP